MLQDHRNARANRKSFTLIEMMAVVVVLGVIVSLGLVQFNKTMEVRYARNARLNLIVIKTALNMYTLGNPHGQIFLGPSILNSTSAINQNLGLHITDDKFIYAVWLGPPIAMIVACRPPVYMLIMYANNPPAPNNPFCYTGATTYPSAMTFSGPCPIGPVSTTGFLPALTSADKWQY